MPKPTQKVTKKATKKVARPRPAKPMTVSETIRALTATRAWIDAALVELSRLDPHCDTPRRIPNLTAPPPTRLKACLPPA